MRICFFIPSLGDGGAQRQCIALLNELQHLSDVEPHLILLGLGEHDDSLTADRLYVHRTEVRNFASPAALAFVVRTLRRVRPDLLISWLHPADIWSFAATRIVRGIPWVIAERGSAYPDDFVFNLRIRLGRLAADAVIANSSKGRELWKTAAPHVPARTIPNMVIEPRVSTNWVVEESEPDSCLYVGRLEPEKNVGEMAAAFACFASENVGARLTVVGKGSRAAALEQIARDGGVADRVDLLGFRFDVPSIMARARVLLSFSRYEGMPNVLMEAVHFGLPAVVSDIPEHRALLGDDYPYYVRLGSPPDTAAAVIRRAWADGLRGEVAKDYAYARHVLLSSMPEKVASAYVDAFADVIANVNSTKRSRHR